MGFPAGSPYHVGIGGSPSIGLDVVSVGMIAITPVQSVFFAGSPAWSPYGTDLRTEIQTVHRTPDPDA